MPTTSPLKSNPVDCGQKLVPTSPRIRVDPVDADGRHVHHEVVRPGDWGRGLRDAQHLRWTETQVLRNRHRVRFRNHVLHAKHFLLVLLLGLEGCELIDELAVSQTP